MSKWDKITKKTTQTNIKKNLPKKDEPSKRFNMRIPNQLFERLEVASEQTGLSKTAIIIKGLYSELNKLDKE